jgi:hypothetical protein
MDTFNDNEAADMSLDEEFRPQPVQPNPAIPRVLCRRCSTQMRPSEISPDYSRAGAAPTMTCRIRQESNPDRVEF